MNPFIKKSQVTNLNFSTSLRKGFGEFIRGSPPSKVLYTPDDL